MAVYDRPGRGYRGQNQITRSFCALHPFPLFIYYGAVMTLCLLLFHPLFLLTASVCMFAVSRLITPEVTMLRWIGLYVLTGSTVAVLNPLFSHRGVHIVGYWLDQPITLESIVFGCTMGCLLVAVLMVFVSFNKVMTNEKLLFLLAGTAPKLALLVTMALRFVPLLQRRLSLIMRVQRTRGIDPRHGPVRERLRSGMRVMEIFLTWSLEEALQTADSMKARGYGVTRRTAYQVYRMNRRDWLVIAGLLLLFAVCLVGWFHGYGRLAIYPGMESPVPVSKEWLYFSGFILLLLFPIWLEGWDALRWHIWKSIA